MPFQTKIQSLTGPHSETSGHYVQSACDWQNAVNWQIGSPGGDIYICKISINDGSEIAFTDATTNIPGAFHEYPIGFDANGVYVSANFADVVQCNLSTIALVQQLNTGVAPPQGSYSPLTATDHSTWILQTGFFSSFTCLRTDVTPMVTWMPGIITFTGSTSCGCPGIPGSGIGYVVCSDTAGGGSATPVTIYKANVNSGIQVSTLIATIHDTDVDAGWTAIGQQGMCVDQTDGHLLLFVEGSAGGSSLYYMLKVNHTTGAIVWKLAMDTFGGGNMVAQSQIKNQTFAIVKSLGAGTNKCTVIDTNAGAVSYSFTTGMDGFLSFGNQGYNDQSGAIVGEFAYSGGPNSPIPLNSTTTFTGWGALYVTAPPNPGPATGTHASYVRIWGNMPR